MLGNFGVVLEEYLSSEEQAGNARPSISFTPMGRVSLLQWLPVIAVPAILSLILFYVLLSMIPTVKSATRRDLNTSSIEYT